MEYADLQVGAIVLGDKGAVTLAQDCDLLLNVLDVILRLLQVDYLNGDHRLGAFIDAFEHLPKRALSDLLQLGEELLRVSSVITLERKRPVK